MESHRFGKSLRSDEALGEIEARIDVTLRNVDDLTIECDGALAGRVKSLLPALHNLVERVLGTFVKLTGLRDVCFGIDPNGLGHLTISGELLEFFGCSAIGSMRRVSG